MAEDEVEAEWRTLYEAWRNHHMLGRPKKDEYQQLKPKKLARTSIRAFCRDRSEDFTRLSRHIKSMDTIGRLARSTQPTGRPQLLWYWEEDILVQYIQPLYNSSFGPIISMVVNQANLSTHCLQAEIVWLVKRWASFSRCSSSGTNWLG